MPPKIITKLNRNSSNPSPNSLITKPITVVSSVSNGGGVGSNNNSVLSSSLFKPVQTNINLNSSLSNKATAMLMPKLKQEVTSENDELRMMHDVDEISNERKNLIEVVDEIKGIYFMNYFLVW